MGRSAINSSSHHSSPRNELGLTRRSCPAHHRIQHGRGMESDSFRVGLNARERRIAQRADDIVVIDADHRDIIRYAQVGEMTSVQHLLGSNVVAGQNADRRGK